MTKNVFIVLALSFVMFNCEKEDEKINSNEIQNTENFRTAEETYTDHLITDETASSMLNYYMETYESGAEISWYSLQDLKDYISYVEEENEGADPTVLGLAFYYSKYDETTAPHESKINNNTIFMSPANYVDEYSVDASFLGSENVFGVAMNMSGCCPSPASALVISE